MILGNFIFAVPHFQNTPNCSFKYFESSDVIAAYWAIVTHVKKDKAVSCGAPGYLNGAENIRI